MRTNNHQSIIIISVICCLFPAIPESCADTIGLQYSQSDTTLPFLSEKTDTSITSEQDSDGVNSLQLTSDIKDSLSADSTAVHELGHITVQSVRLNGRDAAIRPTVIEGKEIRESSRSTPLEVLSQKSGSVYITSKGTGLHGVASGASGGIYIRGLGGSPNSQILVVEDGIPDYQGFFGHPIPDAFSPSLIDRVMIVKGGDGVLYGTNAMGGVIIIENRWPDIKGCQLENDAAFGSFNTFRDRTTLAFKGEKVDLISAFSALNTDGYRDGTEGNSIAGQLGVRFRLPKRSTISIRNKTIRLQGSDPGPTINPTPDHRFEVLRNTSNAKFEYSGQSMNFSIATWLNAGEHRLYDGFLSRDYTAGALAEYSVSLINQMLNIIAGSAGEYVDGTVSNVIDNSRSPIEELSNVGLYSQITLSPGWGFTAVAGGIVHYHNDYGVVPLYKACLNWKISEWITLHTRISKNFRQPTIRELYLPFPVANPDLRPENAVNMDAGTELKIGPLQLCGSLFKTSAKDMIRYFGQWPGAEVVNIDRLDIWGVEGEASIDSIGPFALFLTASWQDVGRYTKQNPSAKINGTVSFLSVRKRGTLDCSLNGEWINGLYMNNYKRDPLDDIFFIDGSLRYRMTIRGNIQVEPYCIIRNILNSRYEYIKYYRMPGINFLTGITIRI